MSGMGGQYCLEGTFIPRHQCPGGQSCLGMNVRGDTFSRGTAMPPTPGHRDARITSYICPTFYSGVHKVAKGNCCVGGKIILIVRFYKPLGRLELSVCVIRKKLKIQRYAANTKLCMEIAVYRF